MSYYTSPFERKGLHITNCTYMKKQILFKSCIFDNLTLHGDLNQLFHCQKEKYIRSIQASQGRWEELKRRRKLQEMSETIKNPSDDLPIKKRINTELFIDRNNGLYVKMGDKKRIRKISQ